MWMVKTGVEDEGERKITREVMVRSLRQEPAAARERLSLSAWWWL